MIKYLGSKRILVPAIVELVKSLPRVSTVLDLFSGTSRVGHALKHAGYCVMANDHNAYAATLGRCYVQADKDEIIGSVTKLIRELNAVPGEDGYFTKTFCEESHFFQPKNGRRVDGIRRVIEEKSLDPEVKSVLLASLMEAADRVDSTTGVQMAFLKEWAPRAYNDLLLRVPEILPRAPAGKGRAFELDACDAAATLEADVTYIDPPYNQHKYLGNYHIWETLVRWDEPVAYGTARKREDCRSRRSVFNSRGAFKEAISQLLSTLQTRYVLLSFNDEGYLSQDTLESMLAEKGHVYVFEVAYPRYVGARIGIHNPKGEKVGRVGRLKNKEMIYLASPHKLASHRLSTDILNRNARVRAGQWAMSAIHS
jgi:adenine-specific DNA-methyltransferase